MSPKRRPFSPEFKEQAVTKALDSKESIAQVACGLGISEQTLRNWISAYRRDHAGEEPPPTANERTRLKELERENRELRLENEFLKKAGSAGINRSGEGDARALRRRSSEPRRPRAMWLLP